MAVFNKYFNILNAVHDKKKIYRRSSFAKCLALEQDFKLTLQSSDKGRQSSDKGPIHQGSRQPNLPSMNGIRPCFSSGSALLDFPWLNQKFSCNNLVAN